MHPTAARALPPDQARWAFEAKWDGYRALAHVAAGQVRLRSRHGVDMTGWFPELAGLPPALEGHAAVLDGEVVALDADGRPDFEALQRRMGARARVRRGRPVAYLFFDLLWLDGRLLCPAPYAERRRLLDELGVAGPAWQPVASFPGEGTALLAATRAQGLEGVVAKRLDSPYLPGRRSRLWLKVKHYQREEFVVGGFVPAPGRPGGPPVAVAALLVGTPDPARPGRLRFAGRVDHGMVPATRRRLAERLAAMVVRDSPFVEDPAALAGGRWRRARGEEPPPVFVRPELTVEVTFLGWEAGRLRHATLGRLG
jgi:bifunctional non-homologous end joining protein LigD